MVPKMDEEKFWTEDVLLVGEGDNIRKAAGLMHEKRISSLLIVTDKKPVGIITERDIVTAIAEGKDPDTAQVGDVMTRDPITIKTDGRPIAAKKIMLEHNFRHMPVVDDAGNLVGIISLRDLIRIWLEDLAKIWGQ